MPAALLPPPRCAATVGVVTERGAEQAIEELRSYEVCFLLQLGVASAATHASCATGSHCTLALCRVLSHCTALHCTVLHCTALHCTVLYCTVLHCTVPNRLLLYAHRPQRLLCCVRGDCRPYLLLSWFLVTLLSSVVRACGVHTAQLLPFPVGGKRYDKLCWLSQAELK
jgi:hypothetical protein